MAGVTDELLAHQLQPPVHVLLGVQQMLLNPWSRVEDELQQGVIAAQGENIRPEIESLDV